MLNGLVLSGGQSRRMGQDKAMMRYKGETLLEHAAKLLTKAGCQQVLISRNAAGYLQDVIPDGGPLAGVHAALETLNSGDDLLVLPVDMPQMSPAYLQALWKFGQQHQKPCYVASRMLPFYLPVNDMVKATLTSQLIERQERKVIRFLDAVGAITFAEGDDTQQWLNLNSPEDWPDDK